MLIVSYLILGAVTGMLAGLLGIGGGLVIVPALALAFSFQEICADVSMHLAIGTSLACMIFTTGSAVLTHYHKNAIHWYVLFWTSLGLVFGSVAGGLITANLDAYLLRISLGCFAWVMAIRMFTKRKVSVIDGKIPEKFFLTLFGSLFGCIATIFGIGGAMFSVPLFCRFGFSIQKAVATASACSLPIALIGAITSMLTGTGTECLPKYTTGYVYWPAFAGIILGSIPGARIGAKITHKLPAQYVRILFSVLLLIVGSQLIIKE